MVSRLFTRVKLGHVSRTRVRSDKQAKPLSLAELKVLYAAAVHGAEVVDQRDAT